MDKILLIDGQNMIWKACVAIGKPVVHELSNDLCICGAKWDTSDNRRYGEKYLSVYNFFRSLRKLIERFSPDKCFFALEGYPQFRYNLYAEYKANRLVKTASRAENQEKVYESVKIILDLMKYLPITLVKSANYEGDDVIFTLCENLKDEDLTVSSSDTDFIQLLQRKYKKCQVYDSRQDSFFSAPEYSYVFWKALCGDTSDNIPGFDGIGKKKAEKLLLNPDMFMNFISLEENRANFNIYRQLVEFHKIPDEELEISEGITNFDELKEKFNSMSFSSLLEPSTWSKFCKTFECIKF